MEHMRGRMCAEIRDGFDCSRERGTTVSEERCPSLRSVSRTSYIMYTSARATHCTAQCRAGRARSHGTWVGYDDRPVGTWVTCAAPLPLQARESWPQQAIGASMMMLAHTTYHVGVIEKMITMVAS